MTMQTIIGWLKMRNWGAVEQMIKTALLAAALVGAWAIAKADTLPTVPGFMTIEKFMPYCLSDDIGPKGLCLGYVSAVADLMLAGASYAKLHICPGTASPQNMVDALQQYLVKNYASIEQIKKAQAAGMIAYALADAYPCK